MKANRWTSLLALAALALLVGAGCGHKGGDGHGHDQEKTEGKGGHDHEAEAPTGASFKPGKGVMLTDETRKLLGVETVEVAVRALPREIRFLAQVFGEKHAGAELDIKHVACVAQASGLLSPADAALLRVGLAARLTPRDGGEIWSGLVLDVHKAMALGDAEVVVGITNAGVRLKPGDFLSAIVSVPRTEAVTVVPRSALLRAAEGTFVYTVNGNAYFRTTVKVGVEAEGVVEIPDGLLVGDSVVTKPVEKLWLIELRAVKGGGHSH